MNTFLQDVRYGFRQLIKNPLFSVIAVLTLALGIGANTAIFSLVNTVLLRPFPVHHSDQLVSLNVEGKDGGISTFSYPDFKDFQERNEVLDGIYATRITPMSLSHKGSNERIWGYEVSGNYFEVLGIQAIKGRIFTNEADRVKLSSPVIVLSYACWQNRFGGDAAIIDKEVIINGHTFKVIGVTPEGFTGTELIFSPEIFVPMTMLEWIEPGSTWLEKRGTHNIFVSGRLKEGVSQPQAETALNILATQLANEYPDTNEGMHLSLGAPGFILPSIRTAFVSFSSILLAIVSLVLLIACTNLASLMMTRATKRSKEIAIRQSLGASRWQLIRQLLTESLLLSLLGGTAGLLLASWIVDAVLALKPPIDLPVTLELKIDWRVMVFSLAISLITAILFGLIPALQATKTDIVSTLKSETTIGGHHRSRIRNSLVVAQIALSLILLVAAGLVLQSLKQLQTLDVGFQVSNGIVMSFDIGLQGYDEARGQQFQKQILNQVRSLPGVKAASLSDLFPLSGNYSNNGIYVEGQPTARGMNVPNALVGSVAPEYFKAMEIPVLEGREFTEQDEQNSRRVVVVNEAFVRRFLPEAESLSQAIGRRFSYRSSEGPFMEIIGIAKNGKYWNITEEQQPFSYTPLQQSYNSYTTLIVRGVTDARPLIPLVRNEFRKLDENLPVFGEKTLEEHLGFTLFPARVAATLLSGFSLVALILATLGIYGVMSYSVAQRTREIGIRMALGAKRSDVLQLILKQGIRMAVIGMIIGLVAAFSLTRLMSGLLYGTSATDPWTFTLVSIILASVALVACLVPARRATKVDPMVALRYE
ncbi:MAG: ABC transporter permease [Acidobacteriota bacterium]